MKPVIDNKSKLKNVVTTNPQINPSNSSNRNIIDLKNALVKNQQVPSIQTKQRNTHGQQSSNQVLDQKLPKALNPLSSKDALRPLNNKLGNRDSVRVEANLISQIPVQKKVFLIEDVSKNIQKNSRNSTILSNQKNQPEIVQNSLIIPNNEVSKSNNVTLREHFKIEKIGDAVVHSEVKHVSAIRLSYNNVSSNLPIKQNFNKSFLDKESSSITGNSQNQPKQDSIAFMQDDDLKLTQRSHDPKFIAKKENKFKNSFVVNNQEDNDQSKISVDLIQSIKVLVDEMKKSSMEESTSDMNEKEEKEILYLEEKINRLRAKLITQGFKTIMKWVKRKARTKLKDGMREILILNEEERRTIETRNQSNKS